ncbi:hypothetical protein CONCODRAFT_9837, partial [Conidiobolus coronatus NRRL 28638]
MKTSNLLTIFALSAIQGAPVLDAVTKLLSLVPGAPGAPAPAAQEAPAATEAPEVTEAPATTEDAPADDIATILP